MKKKVSLLFFNIFILIIALYSQDGRRYIKETKTFYNSIRDSVLINPQYGRFITNDTLILREYLWNYHVFGQLILFGEASTYGFLNDEDKKELIQKINSDTAKFYFKDNFIKKSKVVSENEKLVCQRLSKPIFLKNYTLCIFSIGSPDNNSTFLYRKGCKKEWIYVKRIGRVSTY